MYHWTSEIWDRVIGLFFLHFFLYLPAMAAPIEDFTPPDVG